jgi:hypothetical protein
MGSARPARHGELHPGRRTRKCTDNFLTSRYGTILTIDCHSERTLQPGSTQSITVKLAWRLDNNIGELQSIAESNASQILGLEDDCQRDIIQSAHQSRQQFDDRLLEWPDLEVWACWRRQQVGTIGGNTAVRDFASSTVDLAVLWRRGDIDITTGYTAICNVSVQPRHSPLLPALINLLKVDKAAARAMYEETNVRRRQMLTSVLNGDMASEDNPLQVAVRWISPPVERGRYVLHSKRPA